MLSENYRVECKLLLTDGSEINITDYIKDIIIVHSLNLFISEVTLVFTRNVMNLYKTKIKEVFLEIRTHKHEKFPLQIDQYKLVPLTYRTTLSSPTSVFKFENIGTTARDFLQFYIKPCYDAVNFSVGPILKFYTTIEEILNEIKPDNVDYILNSNLNQNVIPQVYLRKQTFLSALNQIAFLYGLSYGPVARSVVPMKDNPDKALVLISDIHQVMTEAEDYDKTFIIRVPSQNVMQRILDEIQQEHFVVDFSVEFTEDIIPYVNYVVITKPYRYIYKKYKFTENELINQKGAVYKHFDREIENCKGQDYPLERPIMNHSCFDEDIQCITSMLTYEYMFNVRGVVKLQEIPNLNCIWPGEISNIVVPSPDATIHSGLYVVETVIYRLTRDKAKTWQQACEVSIVRTNMIYQPEQQSRPSSIQEKQIVLSDYEISNSLETIENNTSDIENSLTQTNSEFSNINTSIQDVQNETVNLDTIDSNIQTEVTNLDTQFQNIETASHSSDVLTALNIIDTILDLLLTYLNNYRNHSNNILTINANIQTSAANVINNTNSLHTKISENNTHLSNIGSFRSDLSSQLETNVELLSTFVTESRRLHSSLELGSTNLSTNTQDIQRLLGRLNNEISEVQNNISFQESKITTMKSEIQYIQSNGPYDDSDLDWLKSYVSRNIKPHSVWIRPISASNKIINLLQGMNDILNSNQDILGSLITKNTEFKHYLQPKKHTINTLYTGLKNV